MNIFQYFFVLHSSFYQHYDTVGCPFKLINKVATVLFDEVNKFLWILSRRTLERNQMGQMFNRNTFSENLLIYYIFHSLIWNGCMIGKKFYFECWGNVLIKVPNLYVLKAFDTNTRWIISFTTNVTSFSNQLRVFNS